MNDKNELGPICFLKLILYLLINEMKMKKTNCSIQLYADVYPAV